MTLWRYSAVPVDGGPVSRGHLDGQTAAEVRAMLRGLGLTPLEVAQSRPPRMPRAPGQWLRPILDRHLRTRRRSVLADLLDGIATLLRTGTPLASALEVQSAAAGQSGARTFAAQLASRVRQGDGFSDAARDEPGWFDAVDVGMIAASEASGALPEVLERLSERHRRSEQLGSKLVSVLSYPVLVGTVGIGVWLFLSSETLPPILQVLSDAEVEPPGLSVAVAGAGQWVLRHLALLVIGLAASTVGVSALLVRATRTERGAAWLAGLMPRAIRRAQLAALTRQLGGLTEVGVPVTRALQIASETVSSPALRAAIARSCARVDEGRPLSAALAPRRWFDDEFVQLVSVGEESGELPTTLARAAERYERQAQRLVDRLASALEPAAILGLAIAIGVVVMAAVLPMLELQRVLG